MRNLALLLVAGIPFAAHGVDTFRLEARTPASGVFEYELSVPLDPLWSEITVGSLGPSSGGLVLEHEIVPDHWSAGDHLFWEYDPAAGSLVRPYRALFRSRTEWTAWKQATALILFELGLNMDHPFWQYNEPCPPGAVCTPYWVGYANLDTIVPCPAEEADRSLPYFYSVVESLPDPVIKRILLDERGVLGFDYQIEYESVIQLQSSSDLETWNPVADFLAVKGEQQWLSPEPLIDRGNFYRLNVVAGGHPPEPAPDGLEAVAGASAGVQSVLPSVSSFRPVKAVIATDGSLKLEVETRERGRYVLMEGRTPITLKELATFEASSAISTVEVESSVLGRAGFLAVTELDPTGAEQK